MALKQAREGTKSTIEHDIQSSRGQYFQAHTNLYRGSPTANELNPTFILAQTRFIGSNLASSSPGISRSLREFGEVAIGLLDLLLRILILVSATGVGIEPENLGGIVFGPEERSRSNIFQELETTRSTSWEEELHQMILVNRRLGQEIEQLIGTQKKRRKSSEHGEKECANCHINATPEWRRGPSGQRD